MSRVQVWPCAVVFMIAISFAAAAATEIRPLPTIDLQLRCKKSEAAAIDLMGDPSLKGTAFDLCMRSETVARDALQKAWSDIPASYKSFCVRPAEYSASYVEWIACLEMMLDAKRLRGDRPAVADAPQRCPKITYAADGSIKSIDACAK